jgi:glycosyltransferase involved in cell wall biosynthesis
MRVVVLHNLAPGGAHRRLREQMARLPGDVAEVCLATAEPMRADAHVIPFAPRAPRLPGPLRAPVRYRDLGALLRAWRLAADRVRDLGADAVFANPCRFLQTPAALVGELPPCLYFCDEPRRVDHDPFAAGSRRARTRLLYAPMYAVERRVDGRGAARAQRIVTNSAFTAAEIERAYGRAAEVIPLGVSQVFRDARSDPGPAEHVLSVGSLIPSKGHDLAVAAVARMRRRRPLVVVAPRPDPAEARRLHGLAGVAGVRLEVRVAISDEQLADLYARAHATVYLARREPFGLASLEAQACGSPVVVAADGGLPETLPVGHGAWAVPRRAEAVAERLDALEDPEVRDEVAAAGRAHTAEASWERSAARVGELLCELVA